MSNFVLVIDTDKRPQVPVHPAVARKLLTAKKAAVFRQQPFTIILKESCPNESIDKIELKIDPGSKTTGFALVQRGKVIFGLEVNHRGQSIKNELNTRRAVRRNRRNRHTRYREPRFLNRKRQEGWLAPSLNHRVKTTITWVKRIMRYTPIDLIAQELVKFDLQFQEFFDENEAKRCLSSIMHAPSYLTIKEASSHSLFYAWKTPSGQYKKFNPIKSHVSMFNPKDKIDYSSIVPVIVLPNGKVVEDNLNHRDDLSIGFQQASSAYDADILLWNLNLAKNSLLSNSPDDAVLLYGHIAAFSIQLFGKLVALAYLGC